MIPPLRFLVRNASAGLCCAMACLALSTGCQQEQKPVVIPPKYAPRADKPVPAFLTGTVWEKVDVANTDPFPISSYGLVVNLDNTGDTTAPTAVKQFITKELYKRGFGSKLNPGWENIPPERVLRDKRVAIVQVLGELPPGVRKGQTFDVMVQCLPRNTTSSLAGGQLYLTDLMINGADPSNPFGPVNEYAQVKGFIFVNPAYALDRDARPQPSVRQSLRKGVIMDGGLAKYDRPLFLRLRKPERRTSRYIEQRIIERFQDTTVAAAQDEGIIQIFVPYSYRGDWRHFSKVVTHLYLTNTPEGLAAKARMLAVEAQKPGAPLDDISYCWEAIGPAAMPFVSPLLTDKRPEVAFAAARAAAFIGDQSGAANAVLLEMARTPNHPFQISAVQALGGMAPSASINQMLHQLLDSDRTLVRIEAYKVLARNHDAAITSRVVTDKPDNQKFVLDIVPSHGAPLIYATRSGIPRIAIIGNMPEIATPVMFTAIDKRLSISSPEVGRSLTIFYRGTAIADADGSFREMRMADPVRMASNPDVAEVIERLGGIANRDEQPLDFTYSEIVAILQRLNEQKKLVTYRDGQFFPAAFVLQDPPAMEQRIYSAPAIDTGRSQDQKVSGDPATDAALAIGTGGKSGAAGGR